MVLVADLSAHSSVRLVCTDDQKTAAAYLANLYLPIFTLDTAQVIHRFEVSNQIVGLAFHPNKTKALYAVDDSFGLHIFDIRSNSKKKLRLNPDVENHNVVCTAMSSENILAVSSTEFGGGILDVRGSRRHVNYPNVVTLFDIRAASEPITTYNKRHKSTVMSMEFYKNGHDLLTGDKDGALKCFNCQLRDEDNATRWERWARGPITKVGVINKRIVYGISNRSEATVFLDTKEGLEALYGTVNEVADQPITTTSKAFFREPEFCVGLIKGVNDMLPLVAVHGAKDETFLSLTAMNQAGNRQEKPMISIQGHVGEVKCMANTPELLLTGGEDGKVIIQMCNFKNQNFPEGGLPDHHPITLNRQNLAEEYDREPKDAPQARDSDNDKDDSSDEEEDSSDSSDSDSDDDGAGPSTSSKTEKAKAKAKTAKKEEAAKKAKKEEAKRKAEEAAAKKAAKEAAKKKAEEEAAEKKAKKAEAKRKAEEEAAMKKAKKEEARRKAEEDAERKAKKEEAKKKAEEEDAAKRAKKKAKEAAEKKASESKSSKEASKRKDAGEGTSEKKHKKKDDERNETPEEREERKAKKKATQEEVDAAEAKRLAEREQRRLMKLAETKEERAARKARERLAREEAYRKEKEERKKRSSGEGSSSEAKKPKLK